MKARGFLTLMALIFAAPASASEWDIFEKETPTDLAQYSVVSYEYDNAIKFRLNSQVVMDDFEAYMKLGCFSCADGDLTLAIYGDGGAVPNVGQEFFSRSFTVEKASAPAGADGGWFGVKGMNLALDAGDYWAAFEIRTDQTYYGGLPLGPIVPGTQHAYVDKAISDSYIFAGYSQAWGLRASSVGPANPTVTPEPMSSALFLMGAGAMALRKRRNKKKSL